MKFIKNKKGFTIVEVLFASIISVLVVSAIVSAWTFALRNWKNESERTNLRVDMMKALETMRYDFRLSSLTYMAFYPEGTSTYTAVSLPVAKADSNGFLPLNSLGKIDWEETVIYHLYDSGGNKVLRRTVIDPRDNSLTDEERYAELEGIVAAGEGGTSTDKEFLENVEDFSISTMAGVIDFYDESSTAVRAGKVVFGWANLAPGDHVIRFEITGKNASSSGYDIGIDNIFIEPAGGAREAEYYASSYAPAGMLVLSGGTTSRIYSTIWANNNYLQFNSGGTGSYMEITDYYDLWRESGFLDSVFTNTETIEEEVRVSVDIPDETGEYGDVTWYSYDEAGDPKQEGSDGTLPGGLIPPINIRTVITKGNIDIEGDLIRVRFKASTLNPLIIDAAYITKRNEILGHSGYANQSPTGLTVEEYHRHQQLFFKDSSGAVAASVTIPQGSEVWSEWTAFPFRVDSDYLISTHISDISSIDCSSWDGTVGAIRTYYVVGGTYAVAGNPDWTAQVVLPSDDIFITANVDAWQAEGSVESGIFDTTLSAPVYDEIKWSENLPAGSTVLLKARSSSDEYMIGATDWSGVSGSSSNPHSLSIGNKRYLQFKAELECGIFWETSGGASVTYESYVDDQVSNYYVYDFPETSGEPYLSALKSPWVDDVEIDWPGTERLCAITGYIAKKNDYGQAKLLIDGNELVKILGASLSLSKSVSGKTVSEENVIEIEPRNTGR